jgi:hypothetical protein
LLSDPIGVDGMRFVSVRLDAGASIPLTMTNTAIASAVLGGTFNQTLATAKTTVKSVLSYPGG